VKKAALSVITSTTPPGSGAKYCDERVCMSVRWHISKATRHAKLYEIFYMY